MKPLKFTLLLAGCLLSGRLTAQDPYFIQGIHADKTDVCRGEQMLLSARVAGATYYEFQFREPESGDWIRLSSGNTDTSRSVIEHLFYAVNSSLTVRILLGNSLSEVTGGALDIRVHQPAFDIHPRDLTQCNGGEVTFRASAAGARSYQWESSADGLDFSPLSVTTKFKDVQTPDLKVTGILNSHHGRVFRCRVKDAYQCEAVSDPAGLSVNQLSTAVSPTTSVTFCEGDTARFFPSSVTGSAVSFQWALRKAGQTSYMVLEESERYTGTSAQHLLVHGILPHENSYRVRVGFRALGQNLSGSYDSTQCYLESTRTNYTVHPRPARPAPLDSLESCGPARFLISGTENYSWYTDTLASPVKHNSPVYQTPELSASQVYYYSVKDTRSCQSYRQSVKVFIHPVPAQLFSAPESVCPEETRLALILSEAAHTPLYFFIRSPDLDGFAAVDSLPVATRTEIGLPPGKNTGNYRLLVHSKNRHCTSDTTELRLNVFPPTRIHSAPQDISVCENEKIHIEPGFDAGEPVDITWYHNGAKLGNGTSDSLVILAANRSHEGIYTVKVNGKCGEKMSDPFTLKVQPATTILTQPRDTAFCENGTAIFRISATGDGPLHYQWFINDNAAGYNTDTLVIPHAGHLLNRARIVCRITSGCREVVSDTVTLIVRPLPPPPAVGDTLLFCTSASVINFDQGENIRILNWFDAGGKRLPASEVKVADAEGRIFSVSQTDSHGCESPQKSFLTLIHPAFTVKVISDKEQLCLTGNFNREVQLGTFTSSPEPVTFHLIYENRILESNTTGNFSVQQPGLYSIEGLQGHCSASDSLRVHPAPAGLSSAPVVAPGTETCYGGTALLEAGSSYTGGSYYWWTAPEGTDGFFAGIEVQIPGIISDTAFFVSYGMQSDGLFCESPRGKAEVKLSGSSRLSAGRIAESNSVNCAGFNPPLISSPEAPSGSSRIQWQFTESCENPQWQDIPGASGITYNPGALQITTCFRRKAFNECDTVYSNMSRIHIVPDPSVSISADKSIVTEGDSLLLYAAVSGGTGNCTISWQVNRVSSALTNPNWTDAGFGEIFCFSEPGADTLIHFRARVSCDFSSCNLAASQVASVRFQRPPAPLHIRSQTLQMINCYGSVSYLLVEAQGEGSLTYQWQRMMPGDSLFTDLMENNYLSGIHSPSLRIGSTGNAESPHQARFRCIISDRFSQVSSGEITLVVNRISGNLPNQILCAGNDLHADLNSVTTLTGVPQQFEWQHRSGTGAPWTALKDTAKVSGSATPYLKIADLPELDQVQYRCAVTFSAHNGSCVETTGLMTLKVGAYPEKPADIDKEICQAGNLEKITLYPPENLKVAWYRLYGADALARQPEISTDIPGDYFMQYAYISDKKCESPRALVRVTVHPSPPVPFNTTPVMYDETESMTFSAEGENLKWYRTKTLKQYEQYPPVFTSAGRKSYYVTQTSAQGCESERLLIQSEIRPVFRITAQPQDQANCNGNTVAFSVRITGGSPVTYQWQQEYSGLFIDITGATERDYRISDAGSGRATDGSRYRCIIRSGEKQLISQSAVLRINGLKPSLPDISLCPGGAIDFSRYRDSVSGVIVNMEWQKRTGNTYTTVFEAPELTETFNPGTETTGSFRLRITFQNPGGTCIRNSNPVRIIQHSIPEWAGMDSVKVCEGVTVASLLKTLPGNLILLSTDSTTADPGHLLQQGDQFRVAMSDTTGCITPFRAFTPVILPRPRQNPADTLVQACRFSSSVTNAVFTKERTWWQLPGDEWSTKPEIKTSAEAEYIMAYKTQGENGCFSDSARITFKIVSCYFAGQVDTCMDFPAPALQPDTWNYFHFENGEIFAAVHPQGVNTGSITLQLSATRRPSLEDTFGNRFYPRSLSFNAAYPLSSRIKIRYYMSSEEISRYHHHSPEITASLLLLHQEEFPEDCKAAGTLWLKDTLQWESLADTRYKYVEFETEAAGRYLLWRNLLPAGQLTVQTEPHSFPLISAKNLRVMPYGQYLIGKSRDGTSWQEWRSGIRQDSEIKDAAPYSPETYYRLVFDFGNKIRAALDTAKAELPGQFPECVLLENPVSEGRNIRLYFPGLQKSNTRLVTIQGSEIPLLHITENGGHYQISPVNALSKGSYYLKTENNSGIPCTKRVIVY